MISTHFDAFWRFSTHYFVFRRISTQFRRFSTHFDAISTFSTHFDVFRRNFDVFDAFRRISTQFLDTIFDTIFDAVPMFFDVILHISTGLRHDFWYLMLFALFLILSIHSFFFFFLSSFSILILPFFSISGKFNHFGFMTQNPICTGTSDRDFFLSCSSTLLLIMKDLWVLVNNFWFYLTALEVMSPKLWVQMVSLSLFLLKCLFLF